MVTRDLVSDGEILSQMKEMSVEVPRARDLVTSVRRGRLSMRDACYFLLLEALELRRRRGAGWHVSQETASVGD